jgi:Dolichyl-phosphate-mannose-protein mannosyltransferase
MNGNRLSRLVVQYHKQLFYGTWLLLNLVQSAATGLLDDEAYYWVYSRFPDWGYFDHPPMVAILIKAGYAIFHNEFGVRVLFAVMSTFSVALIQKLLPAKDYLLYYTIMISMGILQIGGIIAIPDTPLLFFTAVFFLVYKNLLEQPGFSKAVLFGLAMALLMYSKYHGALVILFTLISNPKLFLKPYVYVAGITGLLLFSPHLYWQYTHGFPSLQFHLRERNAPEYHISFTLDYLVSQIPLAGPLATPILWWAAFSKKITDRYIRALKFTMVGIYVFFVFFTLKGRVEANWTIPAFIPLIVLSHQFLINKFTARKWLSRLAVVTISLMFCIRLYTMIDFFPDVPFKGDEFLRNKEWATAIKEKANGLPVFFVDSYQRPAKYWFYTGDSAFSLNTVDYRRNNFNFWPMEESFMNKKAYAIYQGRKQDYFHDSIATAKGIFLGRTIENYFSFSRIRIIPQKKLEVANGMMNVPLEIIADDGMLKNIKPPYDTVHIWLSVYEKDSVICNIPTNLTLRMVQTREQYLPAMFHVDLPEGKYQGRFGITSCIDNWPTMNSTVLGFKVDK